MIRMVEITPNPDVDKLKSFGSEIALELWYLHYNIAHDDYKLFNSAQIEAKYIDWTVRDLQVLRQYVSFLSSGNTVEAYKIQHRKSAHKMIKKSVPAHIRELVFKYNGGTNLTSTVAAED